jgi:hypothetical protein
MRVKGSATDGVVAAPSRVEERIRVEFSGTEQPPQNARDLR